MNNPFDRDRSLAASSLNNPFDSDPTHARNRFPDISQTNAYQNQQQPWSQSNNNHYSQFSPAQPTVAQFSPYGQPATMSSPYPTSAFATAAGVNPYSTPSSPYANAGFAGGVASGGTYNSPMVSPPMGSVGSPYSNFNTGATGYGVPTSPSYTPHNFSANPQLSQFDPLSSASGGGYNNPRQPQQLHPRQQQPGYDGSGGGGGGSNTNQSTGLFQLSGQDEMDPGPITWYPRSPANPRVQVVSAFGGQTTLHIPIRPHAYTSNDHPRHIISMHRAELEQWDQYGWRQALNALENLRIAWEGIRDDIARVTDIGCPPHENAITTKVCFESCF